VGPPIRIRVGLVCLAAVSLATASVHAGIRGIDQQRSKHTITTTPRCSAVQSWTQQPSATKASGVLLEGWFGCDAPFTPRSASLTLKEKTVIGQDRGVVAQETSTASNQLSLFFGDVKTGRLYNAVLRIDFWVDGPVVPYLPETPNCFEREDNGLTLIECTFDQEFTTRATGPIINITDAVGPVPNTPSVSEMHGAVSGTLTYTNPEGLDLRLQRTNPTTIAIANLKLAGIVGVGQSAFAGVLTAETLHAQSGDRDRLASGFYGVSGPINFSGAGLNGAPAGGSCNGGYMRRTALSYVLNLDGCSFYFGGNTFDVSRLESRFLLVPTKLTGSSPEGDPGLIRGSIVGEFEAPARTE
jgi:hypothetical protein